MTRRVLIIDDDPVVRDLVHTMLTVEGFQTMQAENGLLGIKTIDTAPRPLDLSLIVLDVMMPEMNGLEVLTHLRSQNETRGLPVIMLTGEDKAEDVLAGYNVGADYYITKPFTRAQLMYGVKGVLTGEW